MNKHSVRVILITRLVSLIVEAVFLFMACFELWQIAWGSGNWIGQLSSKWALVLFAFILFCLLIILATRAALWHPQRMQPIIRPLIVARERLSLLRWLLIPMLLIAPIGFLQYTKWGDIINGSFLRLMLCGIVSLGLAILLTSGQKHLWSWGSILSSVLLSGSAFILAAPLRQFTDYPFSLTWSEGNRLWDYSILFGRARYDYPLDLPIPAYIDFGRQLVGGLAFLLPGLTIEWARLWVALTFVLPYALPGWIAFKLAGKNNWLWLLGGLWAFVFLYQGGIHPPLVLAAFLVAIAWRRPLWIALPLVAGAAYFAQASRWTWLFAPAMWAGMLELGGAVLGNNRLSPRAWIRAISAAFAGLFGGYLAPILVSSLEQRTSSGITISSIAASASSQPLLWYRLLPNATYGSGVLLGLLLAAGPLAIILVYLVVAQKWHLNSWQKLAVLLPLVAFLGVGLVISTKIGGGGDLHNLDMFLIGILFAGAIAWRNGGSQWVTRVDAASKWTRMVMLSLVIIPLLQPLLALHPLTLPAGEIEVRETLDLIQNEVTAAAAQGEVLFMDQRQLLTFGIIQNIPLVPEYEKKLMMDQAMSGNASYFENYYHDLLRQRFSLILTEPLRVYVQGTTSNTFAEENNAWVRWVSIPTLCLYRPIYTSNRISIQLLVPREDANICREPFRLDRR